MELRHDGDVVFIPARLAREGRFALLEHPEADSEVEIVAPDPVQRRRVPARLLSMAEAIPWLAGRSAAANPSQAAWALTVRGALTAVASGRLRRSATAGDVGVWRLERSAEHEEWLDGVAAGMPPIAHAAAAEGTRVHGPAAAVRLCWEAVGDSFPRTAAASAVSGSAAYGGRRAAFSTASKFRERLPAPLPVVLRLELPEDGPPTVVAAVRLDPADPEATVPVASVPHLPTWLRRRCGPAAFDAALALARATREWPRLALLAADPEARLTLDDDGLTEFLDWDARVLRGLGLEADTSAAAALPGVGIHAVIGEESAFSLEALCEIGWDVTLAGDVLTPEELDHLLRSDRSVVRLRGRWVAVDRNLLTGLRDCRRTLGPGEALAAALSGTIALGDGVVEARAASAVAAMQSRLEAAAGAPREADPPDGLQGTLRAYQRRGLAWLGIMADLGLGGCLADDMGLGKTLQVIALHLARRRGPLLVVCPTSLLGSWEREVQRFAPQLPVRRYHGLERTLDDLAPDEVVLVSYGVTLRDTEHLGTVAWDLVVADEAQHVKNVRTRAAQALRNIRAHARIALTGTPVENRLLDLWAILDWTTPGLLGSREAFRRRLALPIERGDADAADRLASIVRPFLLRRRKDDPGIAPELPPKVERDVPVTLTREQQALYTAVVREAMASVQGVKGMARRGRVLKLITTLKQVCNHPAQYLHETAPLHGRSGKLEALDELLDVILAEGDSALVFTQYVEMGRLLVSHLHARDIGTAMLHGGLSAERRDTMVADFQAGEPRVLVLSLRAAGVGLTLTRARHVIHFDRWWNPAVEDQATDRTHRIGQQATVEVHRLIAEGTLEERIAEVMTRKRALADSVLRPGEAWVTELSDDQLTELVALQRAPS